MADLHYLSITELAQRLKRKDLSPVELTQAILERLDPALDCYSEVIAERALAAARTAAGEIPSGAYRGRLRHRRDAARRAVCGSAPR